MPRLVRDSDEEEDVKHGRKTRALTEAASVDSPLRRSSRIKPAIRENESSPESLLSDASNVSNTQTTRVRTRQKLAMDGSSTENQRTLRSRINSVSSDVSEVAETDVGTLSKRTARTNFNDALNKTNNRRSKRFTRAGSEANSPPPATRFTRSTRASSVGPETDTRKNESTCTPVKIRKRTSVLPSEVTVIEEKIPVVAIDRTLPNVNIVNKIDLKDSHKASVKESDNLLIENMGTTMNEEDPDSSDNMQKLALSTETESVNESIHSESSKKNVSLKVRRNSSLNNSIEDVESVKDENEVESNHSTEINTKLCEQSEKIHNKENKDISIKMDVSIEKVNMDEIKESESDKSNTSENIHESNEISKKANTSGSVLENNEMNEKANISENVNETNEMSEKANISENVTETNEMSEKANTSGSVLENNEMNEKANISKNVTETNEMSKNANTSENVTETNEMSKNANTSENVYENNEISEKANTSRSVHENSDMTEKANTSEEINEVTDKLNTSENVHKKNEMSSINALSSPNLNNVKLSKSSDKILITDISHSKHEDTHDLKDNNGMNNSSTGNISESLDACMNLGDSTVINVNEDNVINAVKNSQSFIVTETSVEFSQEIPESEKQSKKVSVLDNSLTLKNQRIHKLSERKSKTNEEKNKNNQENMEIDNDSDTNVTNLFQDIPADEWKQQKNADTDKNSVHSVSTERLENESEGEYDLVLVDTEAWLTAESAKTKKKKQISDCDSDDTVVLETETDSMKAVNEENMAMDISESKCKLNVSKGKSPNTKGRKSMDPKVIKNKENVIEDLEDIKDVKDTAQDAESSTNVDDNKSIVADNNKHSTSKCNISVQSVRDKSLSKSHKTIEMEENTSNKSNSSEDVPRKRRSLNKSKQDIKNMSDSDNSENKFTIFRKLFFNAESDTNSDDDKESSKSIDSDIQKEYNLYGKDISKFSDDDVPGDECRASETESSDPDDNGSDLADFVVEEGEEESEDEDEDEENKSEDEDEENKSEDEDKENESEEEEGAEIKNKELDDKKDSKTHQKDDDEKNMQEQDENMEVEEEIEEKIIKRKEQNEDHNQKRNIDTSQTEKDKNENSLADLSHSSILKTKKKEKIRLSGEFIVEDLEQSLNESELVFNKKILKLNSMECSTPKTDISKQEKFNSSMETSKTKNSETKHKKVTSKIYEVTEYDSFDKEENKSTTLKEKSSKKLSKTINEGLMHHILSPELLTLLTKTNLSRTMSSKVAELNKTTLAPESMTPTTKYLMKEKLNVSAPVLKLNTTCKKLLNATYDNEQSDILIQIEGNNKSVGESNIETTQGVNDSLKRKLFKVAGNILKNDQQKKLKKRKQSVVETTDLILSEDDFHEAEDAEIVKNNEHILSIANTDDNDETEEHVGKKQKKKKKKTCEKFIETEQNNNTAACNVTKVNKKKYKTGDDILSFSNTNEETKIVTKKRKLSNALPSENEETKTLKKKKKLLNTLPSENEETKILKKKKKLTNVSANEEENVKPLKKKKKVSAVLSNENEGTKILKKKNKVSNALLSENEETKTLKKKKKLLNAASNENGGTKALKKKKKLLNASSSENDETKKKKKGSAVLSNENEETKILKQKKKVPNTSPNENEEPKILKKKKKLSNAIANEEEDIKLVKKKKKDLSNESGETKILKKKKKVPNALSSENENTKTTKKTKEVSDGLPNKNLSKKKKKLLSEDSTLQDEDGLMNENILVGKSSEKKQKLLRNINQDNVKLINVTCTAISNKPQQCSDAASDSDEGPQTVAFSEARNEALGMLKSTLDTIKANKEMKKKKQKEHMERMQRQKEIKIKRLKSKNQTAETNKIEPQKSNIKRLSEEDLERLSDISRLPKKKRSSKKEDQLLSSRSMINSGVKDTKNVYLEEDSTPLSSCISTTEFSVVSLETIKKKKKVPEITSFRQKMLARNKREPVTAYLMYLEKQKASGKAKFCNKSQ
ncbi:PREDICTED: uncharacterized protein DDB_G0284459-like [Habropoda laboriosa]|uniref:uncharacterized protein DDB_G0284459-like n=1 Tax=Habropoda laboriosa TaxID=597456 RepID=UPI00083D3998|nr:PREDICTED: uncharacterized protein DDB_G0284459-like [Habropoda laboriosa]